ncbi:MAG: lysophospholipid acyltransferase family protein [Bacteroidales bacterium]|nr:lysophospholipid acyltransferase family protein [Bacteroidales bacterium]
MKKVFQYIGYLYFRFFIFLVRITPFKLLYFFSDILSFLIFKVARYRTKVVDKNLKMCFPNKSENELKQIKSKFYQHFTDILLESFKGYTLPVEKLAKRYEFVDKSVLENYHKQGKSVVIAFSHYGNWEWATQTVLYEHSHKMAALYKPMRNIYINNYIKKCREARGTYLCPIEKTKYMFNMRNNQCMGFVMLGDQNPSNSRKGFWVNFLGIDTCVLHGIEMYSKMFNLPIVYFESRKVARGYYKQYLSELIDDPSKCQPGEISEKYMKKVEETLINAPEYWLWSHKRWKKQRDQNGEVVDSGFYKNL